MMMTRQTIKRGTLTRRNSLGVRVQVSLGSKKGRRWVISNVQMGSIIVGVPITCTAWGRPPDGANTYQHATHDLL